MLGEHPDAELAPRDVVARAIWRRLAAGRSRLPRRPRGGGGALPASASRPSSQLCQEHGLDPRTEPIPVAPAAHYHMGGIAVDDSGRTSLPGLWACGEVAVDRRPRRQPAGQQLAARGAGLRRPGGGGPARRRRPRGGRTPRGRLAGGASSGPRRAAATRSCTAGGAAR